MSTKKSDPNLLKSSYKPELYTKAKWDTSLGLDYSYYHTPKPKTHHHQYVHHDFPPLFKNTKLISQSDLDGRGDGFQLVKTGNYLYFCHY